MLSILFYGSLSSGQGNKSIIQTTVSAARENPLISPSQTKTVETHQQEQSEDSFATTSENTKSANDRVIVKPDSVATGIIVRANIEGVYDELLENVKSGVVKKSYRIEYPNGDVDYTLLSFVIKTAPIQVIKELVGLGVPVSPHNLFGAASSGDIEKIEYLLSMGLHPNQMHSGPKRLYIAAAGSGNLDALKIFHRLSDSWDLEDLNSTPYLYDKALEISGNPEILKYLEQNGVEPSGLVERLTKEAIY